MLLNVNDLAFILPTNLAYHPEQLYSRQRVMSGDERPPSTPQLSTVPHPFRVLSGMGGTEQHSTGPFIWSDRSESKGLPENRSQWTRLLVPEGPKENSQDAVLGR